jgi:phosphate transport system substrate-binding protein
VITLSPLSVGDITAVAAMVASLMGIATRRYWSQKRIGWRAQLNESVHMNPEAAQGIVELRLFRNGDEVPDASIALVRIENAGASDIHESDLPIPLSFVFEGRRVLGVKVSETSDDAIEEMLLTRDSGLTDYSGDRLTLPRVPLNPRDHFKLLVLLTGIGTTVDLRGHIRGGKILYGHWRRRRQVFTAVLSMILTASLTLFVALRVLPEAEPDGEFCASGQLTVDGSTAFAPIVTDIRNAYAEECPGADAGIEIETSGSLEGVRDLIEAGEEGDSAVDDLMAASDGPTLENSASLVAVPVGVVMFSVVVNKDLGIDSLTLEEIRGIYQGDITNWSQIDPDIDQPVRMVSRGGESGTRRAFEHTVLNGPESAPLSSDNCETLNPGSQAPHRCERDSTEDLLAEINATPGAIGYAEMDAPAHYTNVSRVAIDGTDASIAAVENQDYPFWTVETLYTYGEPDEGSLAEAFLDYVTQDDSAKNLLRSYGHIPCIDREDLMNTLCEG